MNVNPFAFLDEIQMAFSDASNHAKAAIADVDRYVMPPVSYAEFVDDSLRTLSARVDVSYEDAAPNHN